MYSFLGWVVENLYSFYRRRHFQKEGFLNGPYKPMYGTAMILLIVMEKVLNNHMILIIMLCLFVPLIVEYCSGYLLKKIFAKSYWDYSCLPYNFQGIVCPQFALYWLILSFLALNYLQPVFKSVYEAFSLFWMILIPQVIGIMLIDLIVTVRRLSISLIQNKQYE